MLSKFHICIELSSTILFNSINNLVVLVNSHLCIFRMVGISYQILSLFYFLRYFFLVCRYVGFKRSHSLSFDFTFNSQIFMKQFRKIFMRNILVIYRANNMIVIIYFYYFVMWRNIKRIEVINLFICLANGCIYTF